MSFSDSDEGRADYGPFTPGFRIVPFGDLDAVRKAVNPNTAAIFFEPIQGEAGVIVPPDGFVKGLRTIADEHGVLLIADEIQTGFCRTGTDFGCDYEGVKPDVYVLGKSLGGGIVALSAVVSSREILSVFTPGSHGSTFSGNPFACAIGRSVLRYIRGANFSERSAELGAYLTDRIRSANLSRVSQVRGRGLFIGIDIDKRHGKAKSVCEALKDQGILCKDTRDYSIRIAPPLVITREEIDWALERLVRVLS